VKIAVLKFESLPVLEGITPPDDDDDLLMADDRMLVDELRGRDIGAESLSWQDPRVTSGEFETVVLRSTWDYIEQLDRFLQVLEGAERAGSRVLNPVQHVRWNTSKSYLFDLASWGVPIVPVHELKSSDWRGSAERYVAKPVVGAGGKHVLRGTEEEIVEWASAKGGDFVVQPFVPSVETEGEWSFIYFGGKFSHAMLKRPKSGDFRAHSIYGGTIELAEPTKGDLADVDAIIDRLPKDLAYTRIDLLRYEGRLAVIELELIEPVLYMKVAPGAAARLADAVLA
jgi:glutathione synthase/RimK-type ligase-like ATP-grasp enzyme